MSKKQKRKLPTELEPKAPWEFGKGHDFSRPGMGRGGKHKDKSRYNRNQNQKQTDSDKDSIE